MVKDPTVNGQGQKETKPADIVSRDTQLIPTGRVNCYLDTLPSSNLDLDFRGSTHTDGN